MKRNEKPKDHLGNEYNTIQEMCEHWGIEYRRFYYRIHNYKWSLEKSLTEPVRNGMKVGQVVNGLEILEKFRKNGQTLYKTKCLKCGEEREVFSSGLKRGCVSCNKESNTEKNKEKSKEKYEGKVINGIKILEVLDANNKHQVREVKCQYSCGKIFTAFLRNVLSGNTTSCGHDTDKNLKKGVDLVKECSVEGTNVLSLVNRKNNKNNTSGAKGVSQFKSGVLEGKYRAYINFKRKQYNLGVYDTLEDAASARKEAEEKIYGDFLKWYAENHPEQWEKINNKEKER